MNRSYTLKQRKAAVADYRRTQSVTKTIRNLGYPGAWTLYKWLREPLKPGPRPRKKPSTLRRYPWTVKLEAVQMYLNGQRPPAIATQLNLHTPMSVYSWAQIFHDTGQWGLMSKAERRTQRNIPTQASLEASLPDDLEQLKHLAASLMVEKLLWKRS